MGRSLTYKQAGVDVRKAHRFMERIRPLARLTRRRGLLQGIGGFGGLFELNGSSRGSTVLVASADGVGTKLQLAQRVGWYSPLGVDLVAMNVNDLICTGAEPLFFLDYMAVGVLDPKVLLEIVRGIVRGCVESRCVLLGGETAEMPGVYDRGSFDLAGFAVGSVKRKKLLTGEKVKAKDAVLGLASNGLHSNGFTLVQRAFSSSAVRRLHRQLLRPTRIYVRPVLDLLHKKISVSAIAHITGGSFEEKIPRVLPKGLGVRLDKKRWKVPSIFREIQAKGVSEPEMYRSFNMGIGMVVILPPAQVRRVQMLLRRRHLASWVIGEVVKGRRKVAWG